MTGQVFDMHFSHQIIYDLYSGVMLLLRKKKKKAQFRSYKLNDCIITHPPANYEFFYFIHLGVKILSTPISNESQIFYITLSTNSERDTIIPSYL